MIISQDINDYHKGFLFGLTKRTVYRFTAFLNKQNILYAQNETVNF